MAELLDRTKIDQGNLVTGGILKLGTTSLDQNGYIKYDTTTKEIIYNQSGSTWKSLVNKNDFYCYRHALGYSPTIAIKSLTINIVPTNQEFSRTITSSSGGVIVENWNFPLAYSDRSEIRVIGIDFTYPGSTTGAVTARYRDISSTGSSDAYFLLNPPSVGSPSVPSNTYSISLNPRREKSSIIFSTANKGEFFFSYSTGITSISLEISVISVPNGYEW